MEGAVGVERGPVRGWGEVLRAVKPLPCQKEDLSSSLGTQEQAGSKQAVRCGSECL